jgi:hypothetical protein
MCSPIRFTLPASKHHCKNPKYFQRNMFEENPVSTKRWDCVARTWSAGVEIRLTTIELHKLLLEIFVSAGCFLERRAFAVYLSEGCEDRNELLHVVRHSWFPAEKFKSKRVWWLQSRDLLRITENKALALAAEDWCRTLYSAKKNFFLCCS